MVSRTKSRGRGKGNFGDASCEVCNKTFTKSKVLHKFCSKKCGLKSRRSKPDQKLRCSVGHKSWALQNKEKLRDYHYRRKYGITLDKYNEMLAKQNGTCAVCGKAPKEGSPSLAVDHDHKTREIFGILCFYCNHMLIGKIRDPKLFLKAAAYLQTGTGMFVPEQTKKKRRRRNRK